MDRTFDGTVEVVRPPPGQGTLEDLVHDLLKCLLLRIILAPAATAAPIFVVDLDPIGRVELIVDAVVTAVGGAVAGKADLLVHVVRGRDGRRVVVVDDDRGGGGRRIQVGITVAVRLLLVGRDLGRRGHHGRNAAAEIGLSRYDSGCTLLVLLFLNGDVVVVAVPVGEEGAEALLAQLVNWYVGVLRKQLGKKECCADRSVKLVTSWKLTSLSSLTSSSPQIFISLPSLGL